MFTILGTDGKEYGPVTSDKIREWIVGGRANLQTQARRSQETEWKTLGEFPEFAPRVLEGPVVNEPVLTPALASIPSVTAVRSTLELPQAGRGVRLGAFLLDNLIGGLFMLPGFGLMATAGYFAQTSQSNPVLLMAGIGTLSLGVLLLLVVQIYLLTTRGQTIGKKLLSIKIVNFDNEQNPGFVKAVLLRAVVNGLISCVPVIGSAYALVDICFIFRDDRRCLHDLIASTKVVQA